MRLLPRFLALASVAAALTLPQASATVLRAVAFDDKVDHADTIVVGRCVSQSTRVDEASNWILTSSTFQIEDTLKGMPAHEITIVTPGGVAGDVAQEVIGVPRFRVGDENLLFVRRSSAGPTVLYLEQGAYRVDRESAGEPLVKPMVTSPVLVDTGRGTSVAPESARSLKSFKGAVRETMKRREAMRMELLERRNREEASIANRLRQNAPLVILALLGALLASWQLYRRW